MRLATAEISLAALDHNFKRVKEFAPASQIMAVLKANAYGHGLVAIAKRLSSADAFAVARIDEALALRAGGLVKPIVLLEGFFEPQDLPILLANNFQTIIHHQSQLDALMNCDLDGMLTTWLKIDTGMHRLGISPEQFSKAYQTLSQCEHVNPNIRLMTHFACADDLSNGKTQQQLAVFSELIADKKQQTCLANSAAIIGWPDSHGDWVRPGLMMYGVSPMLNKVGADHGLAPVMRLKTRLISLRVVKKGEAVGYGSTWTCPIDTIIGVVAMGYGDGYPRHAPSGTPVMVNGKQVPLVGRVSMDMITVDLGLETDAKIGDQVILWGPELPVEVVAQCADTIPYELLCNITPRVDYHYIE
ncbi:alanine racemase [Pseudoalteromonas tunicata]|uniref:Alanine racemase n=1 Tax=Pseudoalteromonas tunicata D2 TaxID=87626 RepID=A4C8Q2_9GAMM|nr:alanine racemase [Pseudoalteromonas tunicata]ATC93470.1 alanine racemase [Pseudoalteromonas tunicata]AXT32510.1 alanine racemase [Pseudoalteromonas tunicata]EAR28967.1 alanine racemase 1, PLP-binding, biosynthetic [Pseudoalteromonas tunicata D2]MDP5211740.1 alanine racemase [Pseudoalteromonas tunicata]